MLVIVASSAHALAQRDETTIRIAATAHTLLGVAHVKLRLSRHLEQFAELGSVVRGAPPFRVERPAVVIDSEPVATQRVKLNHV